VPCPRRCERRYLTHFEGIVEFVDYAFSSIHERVSCRDEPRDHQRLDADIVARGKLLGIELVKLLEPQSAACAEECDHGAFDGRRLFEVDVQSAAVFCEHRAQHVRDERVARRA